MIANPIPWPDGARCAVAMTWDMDADSAFNWYNQDTADNLVAAQSWTRYDPLVAIPRLVDQFARRDLRLLCPDRKTTGHLQDLRVSRIYAGRGFLLG